MKTLKITKRELVNLCLTSDFHFETSISYPDKCSSEVWSEIENILSTSLSTAIIERNLFLDVNDALSFLGYKTIEELMEGEEIDELVAIDKIKSILVCETLNNAYFELLNKKLVNKENNRCYVPESLSLGINIDFLSTAENVKIANEKLAEKIKKENRPLTTKEMMINFISENKDMVKNSLKELSELKQAERKEEWQVKANALVQKVSNNDFRTLKWIEIYQLIKKQTK